MLPPAEKLQNFFGVFLQFQIGVDISIYITVCEVRSIRWARYSCVHPILSRFRLISRPRGRKSNRICLSYIFISPYVILHCMGGYENKMKFYVRYYFILYRRCRRIEKQQAISHTFHISMLYWSQRRCANGNTTYC